MPHPATMFFLLTWVLVLLSWIFDIYGLGVVRPDTGEEIRVQSLLSPEGIRWWLRNVVTNFTGFAPLGMVMVAMFGIGVAQHSGLVDACIRRSVGRGVSRQGRMVAVVIALGLLSNVVGDAGYVILLPVAATMFHSVGLHPVGGIVVAYVSVACGYSANVMLTTLDSQLASFTQEAADAMEATAGTVGPLCNYYFFAASALLLPGIIHFITRRSLLPALGEYVGQTDFVGYKSLSRRERRAMRMACGVGLLYAALVAGATFSSWGILRSVNGGLAHSPFIAGILFIISLGIGLMGMAFGFVSGRYRTDADVIAGLVTPMKLLGVYFVIAFFAAQMFACFEYSRLDKCLAIMGAEMLASVRLGSLATLVLFVLFTAGINLLMVSATAKWTFMSFIFVPVLGGMDIAPEVVQCAFRIGDSATNAVTPFMFYMPLVLACMRQYDRQANYGSLLRYTWRYSLFILLGWTALFVVWYLAGLPWGM